MRDILDRVEEWRSRGERVAVATVLMTSGAAPRPTSSKMAVTTRGQVVGSISGGCVDTDVMERAMGVLRSGRPQIVDYGYSPEMSWEVGLMCGGSIQVFIEPLEPEMVGPVDDSWMIDLAGQSAQPACRT